MICCKIIADYNDPAGKFSQLYDTLSEYGAVLWHSDTLYVGSESKKLDKQQVETILRDSGYSDFFIKEYTSAMNINETPFITGWIYDWIVRINATKYQNGQQKLFRKISKKLDKLQEEIDQCNEELDKEDNNEELKEKETQAKKEE